MLMVGIGVLGIEVVGLVFGGGGVVVIVVGVVVVVVGVLEEFGVVVIGLGFFLIGLIL